MESDFRPVNRPKESGSKKKQTPKTEKSSFKTPDQAAASDEMVDLLAPVELDETDQPKKPLKNWRHLNVNRKWVIGGVAAVLIMVVLAVVLNHTGSKPVAKAATKPVIAKVAPKPTTVPSTLSGLPVAASVNQQPVTGVMIENSTEARPQSGLSQAGVVFEAVAEGGITRFLALYQDQAPSSLGPVRSARPYYIDWAMGFDAGYAHVGGSPDALAYIKSWNTRDLDYLKNASAYHRITTRQSPHNVYTSIAALNQLEASKGYTNSQYTGFPRKVAAPSKTPTAGSINLTMSGAAYNVHYDYDATSNSYKRSEGGAAQIDANTNQQLSPAVVIAIVVPASRGALDASGAYYTDYAAIGSGAAQVFQDGTVTSGTWSKTSQTSQITFTDSTGKAIKLNPGQTWITVVSSATAISSTP